MLLVAVPGALVVVLCCLLFVVCFHVCCCCKLAAVCYVSLFVDMCRVVLFVNCCCLQFAGLRLVCVACWCLIVGRRLVLLCGLCCVLIATGTYC